MFQYVWKGSCRENDVTQEQFGHCGLNVCEDFDISKNDSWILPTSSDDGQRSNMLLFQTRNYLDPPRRVHQFLEKCSYKKNKKQKELRYFFRAEKCSGRHFALAVKS